MVIPTHERPALLRRLLAYYRDASFAYPLIIADSSTPPVMQENRRTVDALAGALVITHLPFAPSTEIFNKIIHTLKTTNSPYVALCSDDDFIAARAPERCITFLDTHSSYIAVQGKTFVGRVKGGRLSIVPIVQRPIEEGDALTRLRMHLAHYSATFYATHRREILCANVERLAQYRTDNTRFEELALSSLNSIAGRIGVINSLYLVRQSSSHRNDSGSKFTRGWKHIVTSPSYSENRMKFVNLLTKTLITEEKNRTYARETVQKFFDQYIALQTQPDLRRNRGWLWERATAAALLPSAPSLPRRVLQHLAGLVFRVSKPVRTMREEFKPIERLLMEYPDGIV